MTRIEQIVIAGLVWSSSLTAFAQDMLQPGPHPGECGLGMLEPGAIKTCSPVRHPVKQAQPPAPPPASVAAQKNPLDKQVDDFLQNYGKPPPVAVKALLDPTDANIKAWVDYMHQQEARARYVGQRMTALQGLADPAPALQTESGKLSGVDVTGIKIKYYFATQCPYCAEETPILQALSAAYPQLNIEGIESSGASSFDLIDYAKSHGVTFSLRKAYPGEVQRRGVSATPTLFVVDGLNHDKTLRLDGLQTPTEIQASIRAIRQGKPVQPAAN